MYPVFQSQRIYAKNSKEDFTIQNPQRFDSVGQKLKSQADSEEKIIA
jgi:hypothetical protein